MKYEQAPRAIESKSFDIITSEMQTTFDDATALVVKRVIHATGDFDYEHITEFYHNAVSQGIQVLSKGANIYTDTRMAYAGINKRVISRLGGTVHCLVDDQDVAYEAKERGVTRSIVAMERACKDERASVFIIGNAPTALLTLEACVMKKIVTPALVVGVPVGFVSAAESKASFSSMGIPYITTRGRKGGTNVAVAILNALLYQIDDER